MSAVRSRHRLPSGSVRRAKNHVTRRVVAAALPARDPATVIPFNRGSLHAAALSWADGDTTWAHANCGVGVVSATVPIVAVVAVPPDLNIDALGHLDALGLGRSDERGSRQHRCGCRHGKSDLHHGLDLEVQRARTLRIPPGPIPGRQIWPVPQATGAPIGPISRFGSAHFKLTHYPPLRPPKRPRSTAAGSLSSGGTFGA